MTALYPYFKVFHLLGLIAWLGSLPLQALLLKIVIEYRDLDQRRRAARFLRVVCRFQVLPTMTLVVIGGLGMLLTSPLDLLAQPWMKLKLSLVAALIGTELAVMQPLVSRLARTFSAASVDSSDETRCISAVSRQRWILRITVLGYLGVLLLILGRGTFSPLLAGAAAGGLGFVTLVTHLLHRSAAEIAEVLPDE